MPESTGWKIKEEFEKNASIAPVLSEESRRQYDFIRQRIDTAKLQQSMKYREFNGLDFLTDDRINRDIRNSYIRPKLNDEEVRVNTGTVEKKMLTVVNEILNLNIQPDVQVYDENDKPIIELGDVFSNILKRTNEQENDDDLRFPALWDLATRRVMFLEEYQKEKETVDKRKKKYDLENNDIEYETKKYKISRPCKRLLDPRSVLFGDVTIPNHRYNDQPFMVKYDRMHWRTAWSIYHNFSNWQYVKSGAPPFEFSWHGGQFDWRLYSEFSNEEIEIVHYFSYPDDEYQIIVNGVPLLPPSTPLPWEYEGYSIQAFVSREMEQNLAYGQLFTINAKVLAALGDEMLRLIIRKWRQSVEPSLVVKGKKVLSRDIWNPGAVAQGISKDDVQKLVDNTGITESEMATFQMISEKIEDEIGVSKLFQGMTDRKLTATQAIEQMKQAIKAIGVLVLAWVKVVRTMSLLRIYNVIENNTDPIDVKYDNGELKKVFRYFSSADVKLDDDTTGTMRIAFSDKDLTEEEERKLYEYEESEKKKGNYVRYKQINVDTLRQFRFHWFIGAVPQEKESTALQKIMFTDQLNQAVGISNITGRRVNGDAVVNHYERIWKAKNMFEKAPTLKTEMEQKQEEIEKQEYSKEAAEAGQGAMSISPVAGQIESMVAGSVKRPSINSLGTSVV